VKMYKLAKYHEPCILIVHRITMRAVPQPPHMLGAPQILSAMGVAFFRANESLHKNMQRVWTIFIDCVPPGKIDKVWTLNERYWARYCIPTQEEKIAALRSMIYLKLSEMFELETCDTLLAEYEPFIKKSVEPVPSLTRPGQFDELNLRGAADTRKFVNLIFTAWMDRIIDSAHSIALDRDHVPYGPSEADFDTAARDAPRIYQHVDFLRIDSEDIRLAPQTHTANHGSGAANGREESAMLFSM